jgi:hypothetical protein
MKPDDRVKSAVLNTSQEQAISAILFGLPLSELNQRLAGARIASGYEPRVLHPGAFAANRQMLPDGTANELRQGNAKGRSLHFRQVVFIFI